MWLWIVVAVVVYAVVVTTILGIMRAAAAADHRDRSVFQEWASSRGGRDSESSPGQTAA